MILRGHQIVIPVALRSEMINRAHEGHLGIAKTKARARDVMWWPGIGVQLENKVSICDVCTKYRHQQNKEPLMSTLTPERPWQKSGCGYLRMAGTSVSTAGGLLLKVPGSPSIEWYDDVGSRLCFEEKFLPIWGTGCDV